MDQPETVPLLAFRKDLTTTLRKVHETGQPVIVTQNGKPRWRIEPVMMQVERR